MKHDHYPPSLLCVSGGYINKEVLTDAFYDEQFSSGQGHLDATPCINTGGVHLSLEGEDGDGTYSGARDFMMRAAA